MGTHHERRCDRPGAVDVDRHACGHEHAGCEARVRVRVVPVVVPDHDAACAQGRVGAVQVRQQALHEHGVRAVR